MARQHLPGGVGGEFVEQAVDQGHELKVGEGERQQPRADVEYIVL